MFFIYVSRLINIFKDEKILIKAVISYDGSKFNGMQIQPGVKTVQGEIEKGLLKLNIHSKIKHSGRTDKGVHALNQIISFEIPDYWDLYKLKESLNKVLHPYIHIKKTSEENSGFNPRFDAKKRSYRYIINPVFSPHLNDYSTYYPNKINYPLLKKALKEFEGIHNFELFAKTGSNVNSYVREIFSTKIFKYKNFTVIKIEGNAFLRGQIRIIIDFLFKINENTLKITDIHKQLNGCFISKHLAPPNGLYLERIWY